MFIWKTDAVVNNEIEEDLVMYEDSIVHRYLFGIKLASIAYKRTSKPFEGKALKKKTSLGFGSKS
jgi:hypothetical protein